MKTKNKVLTILLLAVMFVVSCNDVPKTQKDKINKDTIEQVEIQVSENDCEDVHWSHHKGENGPENWKNLCNGFADCGGTRQSPVNINTDEILDGKDLAPPVFSYSTTSVDIINNGHTVQFNVDGNNTVNLNGTEYKLLQFHYHALSEHTIDGEHYPLEVHFVHAHSDSDLAVLTVLFVEGSENELFAKYLDKFPQEKGEYKNNKENIDLLSLFPVDKTYYYYKGSLTTPPCTEVVSWYIFKTPVEASKEQIAKFSEILDNNYRPVLPLNGRTIELFKDK